MKKAVLTLIIASFLLPVFTQEYVPTEEDIERFHETKTLVVLDDNPMSGYNFMIKSIMESEWEFTEYDFIPYKEFEEKRLDPNYSFLVTTLVTFHRDKTKAKYRFLNLLLGGDYFRMNQMPDLISIPLCYSNVDEDSYIYKLGTMVRFMCNHVQLITDDPSMISSNMFKYYKDNIEDIQDKVLYVVEDELAKEVNTSARIRDVYPYQFKIVTRDEVEEAIKQKKENVVFLHKVGPEGTRLTARCYKIIMGAKDAKLYYFNYHNIDKKNPDGFLKDDFKNLAKGKGFLDFILP